MASRGKLSAPTLMNKGLTYQETFCQVGQSWDVQPHILQKVQQCTCPRNVAASRTTEVKDLRYQLVCAKRGEIESSLLPLCRDCLFIHFIRANYQAAICLLVPQCQTVPSVDEYWMRSSPAPYVVLELLACKCVRSCKLPKCTCMANGLACADMCKLQ